MHNILEQIGNTLAGFLAIALISIFLSIVIYYWAFQTLIVVSTLWFMSVCWRIGVEIRSNSDEQHFDIKDSEFYERD